MIKHSAVALLSVCVPATACGTTSAVGIQPAASRSSTTSPAHFASRQVAPDSADGPTFVAGDVLAGRFVRTVTIDNGAFLVRPAPAGTQPQINQAEAEVLLESDTGTGGAPFGCSPERGGSCVIGFGEVSITQALVQGAHNVAAWVGTLTTPTYDFSCPNETLPPSHAVGSRSAIYPWEYEVAVLEGSGTPVLNYTSRASVCGNTATGPSLTRGVQSVSIPWQLVALHGQTIMFRYQKFPCDPYPGVPNMALGADVKTEQGSVGIYIEAPYSLTYGELLKCGGSWTTTSADFGPQSAGPGAPPPPTPKVVTHDPTGPVGGSG